MARLGGRAWTWLVYAPTVAASVLFAIVSLVVFGDLAQVQYEKTAGELGSQLNGVLAACFMAPILTAGLVIMSFFVLVKKTWTRSGGSFSYAFCASWSNCCLLILAGVVLTANKHWTGTFEQSTFWSHSATNAYVASYVLAFISAGFQLAQAAFMIANRRTFGGAAQLTIDELGMSPLRATGTPSSTGAAMAGEPAAPFPRPGPRHSQSMPSGAWQTV